MIFSFWTTSRLTTKKGGNFSQWATHGNIFHILPASLSSSESHHDCCSNFCHIWKVRVLDVVWFRFERIRNRSWWRVFRSNSIEILQESTGMYVKGVCDGSSFSEKQATAMILDQVIPQTGIRPKQYVYCLYLPIISHQIHNLYMNILWFNHVMCKLYVYLDIIFSVNSVSILWSGLSLCSLDRPVR